MGRHTPVLGALTAGHIGGRSDLNGDLERLRLCQLPASPTEADWAEILAIAASEVKQQLIRGRGDELRHPGPGLCLVSERVAGNLLVADAPTVSPADRPSPRCQAVADGFRIKFSNWFRSVNSMV